MKRYFVSYAISINNIKYSFSTYGNYILDVKDNLNMRKIENYLKEYAFEEYSKQAKNLKKEDIEIIILFFKELKEYEG